MSRRRIIVVPATSDTRPLALLIARAPATKSELLSSSASMPANLGPRGREFERKSVSSYRSAVRLTAVDELAPFDGRGGK